MGSQGFLGHDLDAQTLDNVDFLIKGGLGKTIFGDSVAHHTAGIVLTLKNRYVMTIDGTIVGSGESGRTCAHNGNLLSGGILLFGKPGLLLGHIPVGNKTLHMIDGHG